MIEWPETGGTGDMSIDTCPVPSRFLLGGTLRDMSRFVPFVPMIANVFGYGITANVPATEARFF